MDNQLTLKFGGDGNIRVETLTEFLDCYKSILHQINYQFGHTSDDFFIEVSPPENGSFKIKISAKYKDLMLNALSGLVIGTLSGLIVVWCTPSSGDDKTLKEIRDILKNQKKLNEIESKDVYKIYQNIDARKVINNSFKILSNDEKISNFSLNRNETEIINIPKENFELNIKDDETIEESLTPKTEIIKDEVDLVLKTIHFEGGSKWGFVFRGYPIKAAIKAPEIQHMLNNESFRKGDVLKVILARKQSYDIELGTYIVDQNSYEIVQIIEHKSRNDEYVQTKISD